MTVPIPESLKEILSLRPMYYRRDGTPIEGNDENATLEWARLFAKDNSVARTLIGRREVSTVYLGLDHNFFPGGKPLIFETMIFTLPSGPARYEEMFGRFMRHRGTLDYQERYSTEAEALEGHARAVRALRWMRKPKKEMDPETEAWELMPT